MKDDVYLHCNMGFDYEFQPSPKIQIEILLNSRIFQEHESK